MNSMWAAVVADNPQIKRGLWWGSVAALVVGLVALVLGIVFSAAFIIGVVLMAAGCVGFVIDNTITKAARRNA